MPLHRWSIGLRAIAVFEVLKGGAVLLALVNVALGNWTVPWIMEQLVHAMHLNPAGRIATFCHTTLGQLPPGVLLWPALAYIGLRFTEAWGLWRERHWGEWLAVLSAGVYIPLEIYELTLRFSPRKVGLLAVNVAIILFLIWVLWKTRNGRSADREA